MKSVLENGAFWWKKDNALYLVAERFVVVAKGLNLVVIMSRFCLVRNEFHIETMMSC